MCPQVPDGAISYMEKLEMSEIIKEAGGLNEYKQYLKQTSIAFAENKNVLLDGDSFEF